MSKEERNKAITHHESDVDFNIYYDYDVDKNNADITGIYLIGSQVDLIDVVSDEVKEDLEQDIEDNFDA